MQPYAPGNPPALPADFTSQSLQRDRMLEYLAATALFQEVQILNTYLGDAAIPAGYEAYIVRLQVSVMPRRRSSPYDCYTTIAFFARPVARPGQQDAVAPTAPGPSAKPIVQPVAFRSHAPAPAGPENVAVDAAVRQIRDLLDQLKGQTLADQRTLLSTSGSPEPVQEVPIKVLPLLVTDNLEAALVSRNRERIREMGLAAMAQLGSVGLGGNMNSYYARLEALLARDLNGLLTVARASDNAVRVRLGASQIGSGSYDMLTRTHNVTALILVPAERSKIDFTIDAVASTELVDAATGEPLEAVGEEMYRERARRAIYRRTGERPGEDADHNRLLDELLRAVRQNRWGAFTELANQLGITATDVAQLLWMDLVQGSTDAPVTTLSIPLPSQTPPVIDRHQTPVVIDDGAACKVTLSGCFGLDRAPDRLRARLLLLGYSPSDPLWLNAGQVAVTGAGTGVTFTFPSLKALGVQEVAKGKGSINLWAGFLGYGDDRPETVGKASPWDLFDDAAVYVLSKPEAPKPNLALRADRTRIGTASNRVRLSFSDPGPNPKEIGFRLLDATISPAELERLREKIRDAGDWYMVLAPGSFDVAFDDLAASKVVQIQALYGGQAVGDPIKIEVVQP